MSHPTKSRMYMESLEARLLLAGDVPLVRADLLAPQVVFVNSDVVGPDPILFEKANFFNEDIPVFIVSHVAHGVVEKYDAATEAWKNISAPPQAAAPADLLAFLAARVIREGDPIRWVPSGSGDMQEAFTVLGWDYGASVVQEAPNYEGFDNTAWPNWIPDQEPGYGQLNNLVVDMVRSQTAFGSDYDLAWVSSLPSGPKVEPTHFYPVSEINGQPLPGALKPLRDVIDLVPAGLVDGFGREVIIHRGIREAGTRVGIHIHEYGGYTLVLSGTITDYVEGQEPAVHEAGDWYYMPPNTPMSAANEGTVDAELIDIFFVPPGQPAMTVIEPGWPAEDANGTLDG